ncbi:hypothetical protein CVT24_010814 [Panaeolus cyanescens]|uniref:Uncharacterized protein n=1 Tax=Panaeolus cyanescens TaxID=181874 RepID=A0A409WQD1_9AGAR|nr:hypothetical protein CVT24_010814 [Panaeolus cyanescens]
MSLSPSSSHHSSFASKPRQEFDLPQEIIDRILDCLTQNAQSDREARQGLFSCLTVSRAFTRRARENLLLDITISDQRWNGEIVLELFKKEPHLVSRLRSFQIQVDELPHYSDLFHNVCHNGVSVTHLAISYGQSQSRGIFSLLLMQRLNRCLSISTPAIYASLTSLKLTRTFYIPIHSFIVPFSRLERLELVRCAFTDSEPAPSVGQVPKDAPSFYQTLESLCIVNEMNLIFRHIYNHWPSESLKYSKLKSLQWSFASQADISKLGHQLVSAPLLENIELTHCSSDSDGQNLDVADSVNIARVPALKTLTLNMITTAHHHNLANMADIKILVSPHLTTTSLQILNINIATYYQHSDLSDFFHGGRSGWKDLDESLADPDLYPNLELVVVEVRLMKIGGGWNSSDHVGMDQFSADRHFTKVFERAREGGRNVTVRMAAKQC